MTYKTTITKYDGALEQLAVDLGDLQYDAFAAFLRLLSEKVKEDGRKDRERARLKLAGALERSAGHITAAAEEMEQAWRICEPHMREPDA